MTLHLDVTYVSFLVSVILPMLTALITKRYAKGWVKTVCLIVLSIIAGFAEQIISNGGVFVFDRAGIYMILTFLVAALVHFGILKPINLTGENGIIARSVPGGLGEEKEVVALASSMLVRSTPEHRVIAPPVATATGRHAAVVPPTHPNPPTV